MSRPPGTLLGAILGAIIPIILFSLCVAVCCVVPCCLCYKKCRKRNQRQIVVTSTVANMPQPPYSPHGYQEAPPSYQAVPGHQSLPLPTAPPPPYTESAYSSYPPVPFAPGQPMYPLTTPKQPYTPADEFVQSPYNPSYYGPQS